MKSIAIITARGGSKRIPKKNIRDFCGKPIIAYSIEAALESQLFDEVMVSTDSEEIAEISKKYGAKVPFMRSAATSNDFATTADVVSEVILEYENRGKTFDITGCIYPTAPFVTGKKIREAMELLVTSNADGIMTVTKYSFPPQRALLIQNNYLKFQYPEYIISRSQDLEPIYHDCGQFYFLRTKTFQMAHAMVLPRMLPYVVPDEEVQDIDTFSDWKIAQTKYLVSITN